jgi:type I restriction enzyme M protein
VVSVEDVLGRQGSLSIPLYVKKAKLNVTEGEETTIAEAWAVFEGDGRPFWTQMDALAGMLDGVVAEEAGDA